MDMLYRTLVAMAKILKILLKMFVVMAFDTFGDLGRMASYLNQIGAIIVSESSVNPMFAVVSMIVAGLVGIFALKTGESSLQSVLILAAMAFAVFVILVLIGM